MQHEPLTGEALTAQENNHSSKRPRRPVTFRFGYQLVVPAASIAMLALSAVLSTPNTSVRAQQIDAKDARGRQLIEVPLRTNQTTRLTAALSPVDAFPAQTPARADRGTQPPCPPVTVTYTDASFEGGTYIMEAGMVADEMAACSYTIPATEFPIIVRSSEIIFLQQNATVTTTTQWSWLVWEGTPDTGNLVAVFSSDDVILPHIVMPPGTHGTNVLVTVDPQDPDQVVVQDNGSHTFTVAYRIDAHNNPPTQSCNFGLTPPECCPPPTNSNAFPVVDISGVANQANNWLYCHPNCGPGACAAGWHRFSALGAFRPSGDWVLRATYEPFTCNIPFGACCFLDGTGVCSNEFDTNCANQGGTFMGDGTDCASLTCPDPIGACCIQTGTTNQCSILNEADCVAMNTGNTHAVWLGAGTTCAASACNDRGACCFTASCSDLSALNCQSAGGVFHGIDSDCAGTVCNPFGACCLPDGSCSAMSDTDCAAGGGIFQGNEVQCAGVSCPQPLGACCLDGGGCFQEEQANCQNIPGATWAGMGTDCATDCAAPTTGACCLSDGGCFIEEQANCEGIPGASFAGVGTNCADDCAPPCPADLTGPGGMPDGHVDVSDLFMLLSNWNTNGPGADLAPPDNIVNTSDLFALLAAWGDC